MHSVACNRKSNSWWLKQIGAYSFSCYKMCGVGTGWHWLTSLQYSWPLPHGCRMVARAPSITSTFKAGKKQVGSFGETQLCPLPGLS